MTNDILFFGFNQDFECFMCGLKNGYRIYNTDPLKENCVEEGGGVKYVEMLYRCNYVGIVGGGTTPKYPKNRAIIWDDFQKKVAISIEFNTEVLAIKLRRDSQTPQLLHTFETFTNPNGLCVLCSHSTSSNLGYLSRKLGHVCIVDLANTEKSPIEFVAHEASISCMSLSSDGCKIATSSTKGTLIRIFNTEAGILLHELRRGANHANIFSISFNRTGTKLCVSSDHGTIHLFNLDLPEKNSRSSLANASFLPKYFQSRWSSFKFNAKISGKFICAFSETNDQYSIIAISSDGNYFKYSLDDIQETKRSQLECCLKFLEFTNL